MTIDTERARGMANALRALSMDTVEEANSGHPGMPMGMADVVTALVHDHLVFDPSDPQWPDRDRLVLSAGHGSALLYSLLHLTGYAVSIDDLRSFRQLGSKTPGHPEFGHCPGVETTTGPLGQGLATAVGMAIAERMLNARFGDDLVRHRTYVIAGDGCLMEGISHEAIDLAGHLVLGRLIVLFDDNHISIDGPTSLSTSVDQLARFAASGWDTIAVDGHDVIAVSAALRKASNSDKPTLIACRTVIGRGAPSKQGTSGVHGSPLGPDEIAAARQELDWPYGPFEIPAGIGVDWRATAARGREARAGWSVRLAAAEPGTRTAFTTAQSDDLGQESRAALATARRSLLKDRPALATRQSSQRVLAELVPHSPSLVGGSADLSGSTGTRTGDHKAITADDFSGNYINYGVREHAMGAIMNGLALHGGFRPYGGTFLVFADYCRPSMRLSSLMGLGVAYVMTHDSIGLGEDGPTHQPVEQLASLRAMPGIDVVRPADALEVADAWTHALRPSGTPTVLVLSRQSLPMLTRDDEAADTVSRGGYVVREASGTRHLTLLASGSEVQLADEAARVLADFGIRAAVVSLPCFEVFDRQPEEYRAHVLGSVPRVAVEAAVRQGWDAYLNPGDEFVGMAGFGASGPAEQLYEHFGITVDAVVRAAVRVHDRQFTLTGRTR